MAKKMAKKKKKVLRNDRTSLSQMEEEMHMGFIELAVPRPFKEVKTNIFKTAPPGGHEENDRVGRKGRKRRNRR